MLSLWHKPPFFGAPKNLGQSYGLFRRYTGYTVLSVDQFRKRVARYAKGGGVCDAQAQRLNALAQKPFIWPLSQCNRTPGKSRAPEAGFLTATWVRGWINIRSSREASIHTEPQRSGVQQSPKVRRREAEKNQDRVEGAGHRHRRRLS